MTIGNQAGLHYPALFAVALGIKGVGSDEHRTALNSILALGSNLGSRLSVLLA